MHNITDKIAKERGTFVISLLFKDEDGEGVTPQSVRWSLIDEDGNTINDRDRETISPAFTVRIPLSGDDLQLLDSEADKDFVRRYLVCEWIYNSTNGNDLPGNDEICFVLENLRKIS